MSDHPVDFDDLKRAWQILDRRVERQHTLALLAFKDRQAGKARASLRPLVWGQVAQIAIGVVLMLAAIKVWRTEWPVVHLRAAALLLHAYAVLLIGLGAWTLELAARLDYAAPVVAIQKQLASLTRWYVWCGLAIGPVWWLLWMPLFMVLAALAGVDVLARAPGWFASWSVFGLAGLALTLAAYRWARFVWPALARYMDDAATGTSLRRARAVIDEVERFEREDADPAAG
jgi:hypothetical protein